MPDETLADRLDFAKGNGLITVIAQDARSGAVLMVAHADRDAIERTLASGEMHYFSRTRGAWHKGATSGNAQRLVTLTPDCDGDAVLARVTPAGPACHTGQHSCFGGDAEHAEAFGVLTAIVHQRAMEGEGEGEGAPSESYTAMLLADRNRRLKKLGEEAAELITACADADGERAAAEAADLIFHVAVALESVGSSLDAARTVLHRRRVRAVRAAQST